jgi:hypothetical protein
MPLCACCQVELMRKRGLVQPLLLSINMQVGEP